MLRRRIGFFLVNRVFAGTRKSFFGIKRKLLRFAGFNIGKGTKIVGPIICTGNVQIGKNCWIGKNFTINGNGMVIIGDNVDIAPDVTFNTGGHEIGNSERRAGQGHNYSQTIGNGCWICARSTFVNELNIGDGCVVAAGAVVTKSFESNQLVGGVPAKTIKLLPK